MKALILYVALGLMLGGSIYVAVALWTSLSEAELSGHGMIAMALGIAVSFALGAGLMFLVFYSSRHGHDDDVGGQ